MGRQAEYGTGSTASLEAAIMDRWEAGQSREQITRDLGLSATTVKRVFGYMVDGGEQRRAAQDMIQGSTRLSRALREARA